jgi:carbon-monoxide dehydrogenase medium subunit
VGGSLAHSDPVADYAPVMLVLRAKFKIRSAQGERVIAAKDFFKGLMQTALTPTEMLVEVQVPKQHERSGYSYQRLHRVEGNFAIVISAALIEKDFEAARLGLGGVAPFAQLIDVTEHIRNGVTDEALRKIAEDAFAASGGATSDLSGSIAYRREMIKVFAQRSIKAAARRLAEHRV